MSGFFQLYNGSRIINALECISTSFLFIANNIPLYGYTHFLNLFIQLMSIWAVSTFCLFWIRLLWIFMYKFLCGHILSFLLVRYLRIKLLDHMVTLFLTFWRISKPFPLQLHHFTIAPSENLISLHSYQYLLLSDF